jgi:hypothetical protein
MVNRSGGKRLAGTCESAGGTDGFKVRRVVFESNNHDLRIKEE